jgi:hypothetical protein
MVHAERHAGSPAHLPRQLSYGEQIAGSSAQADDSAQQFCAAHDAHDVVV